MPPSWRSRPTPRRPGSMSAAEKPWDAQPDPSTVSLASRVAHRSAHRNPNRSRRAEGTMSIDGFWVAARHDDPGRPSPGHHVTEQLGEPGGQFLVDAGHIERQFIDHQDVEPEPGPGVTFFT